MNQPPKDISDLWTKHQRAAANKSYSCIECPAKKSFSSKESLWEHAKNQHGEKIPADPEQREVYKARLEAQSLQER